MNKAYLAFEHWEGKDWQFSYRGDIGKSESVFTDGLELLEQGLPAKAAQKFRAVVRVFPEHIGAIHHLGHAMKEQGKDLDAWAFFELAVAVAQSKTPRGFDWTQAAVSWYAGDNRAYMRACLQLALELIERGYCVRASGYLEHLLQVWPNDNLGVRHVLPECYLKMADYEKVLKHAERNSDDQSPYILYAVPLALIGMKREPEARESLVKAARMCPKVAMELLKETHVPPPDVIPFAESPGGADEAFNYWQRMGSFWLTTPAALEMLRSVVKDQKLNL